MYINIYTCVFLYIWTCVYMCFHIHTPAFTCMCARECLCIYVCVCLHTCLQAFTCTCMHLYINAHSCTCAHSCVCVYTVFTHMGIFTHIPVSVCLQVCTPACLFKLPKRRKYWSSHWFFVPRTHSVSHTHWAGESILDGSKSADKAGLVHKKEALTLTSDLWSLHCLPGLIGGSLKICRSHRKIRGSV